MHSLDELVSVLDRLIARIDELEARVRVLEQRPSDAPVHDQAVARAMPAVSSGSSRPAAAASAPAPVLHPEHPIEQLLSEPGEGIAAVVGKVFLGVAGAYVLRALAESGAVPQLAIVGVALAYAGMWLVWAARVPANARFAGAAYAATSAFIGSPMLWELTLRFKVLPDAVTALLLVAFVAAASTLGWKRNLTTITWVAAFAAAITSLGLLVATRDPAPFALALIAVALSTEVAACFGRCMNLRAIVATALNLALVIVIVIYTAEQGVPPEYKPISQGLLLALVAAPLIIYGAATAIWSVVLLCRLSVLQIIQTVIAFLIGLFGLMRVTHAAWAPALGVFCLAAAAGCYIAAFSRFYHPQHKREYHVFSAWAAALFLGGSWLLLSAQVLALVLSIAAVCAAWAGVRWRRVTLDFHSILYLTAGVVASGLLMYAANALLAGLPPRPSPIVVLAAGLVIVCYAIAWRVRGEEWQHRLIRLMFATQAILVLAAFAVFGIILLIWAGTPPNAARLAVTRTLVICAVALALGVAGSRRNKVELVWTAYGAMALCTLKLLFEDLRNGSTASLAVSLFLYGMVWLLLPRMVRARAQKTA